MSLLNIPKNILITNYGSPSAYLSPEADGLKDCVASLRQNGESTLTFKLPIISPKWEEINPESRIIADGKEYIILKDEADDITREKDGSLWLSIRAIEGQAILNKDYVETFISNDPSTPAPSDMVVIIIGGGTNLTSGVYETGTAGHALKAILTGNRFGWNIGTVDVAGIHDLETERISRLENIKKIQAIWGGILIFDSINKLVHLRDETTYQPFSGFSIKYQKNMSDISRTSNNDIVTRIYPYGFEGLDIASVNSGVKYIQNHSYTDEIYVDIYTNNDISDASELKARAIYELDKMSRPRYNYKSKILDLRNLPEYKHETFYTSDMVYVDDKDLGKVLQRVLLRSYNIFQPWICQVELGDPEIRFEDIIKYSSDYSSIFSDMLTGDNKIPGKYIKNLTADVIISNTIVTQTLYADKGYIAELTVDELNTSDKVKRYLESDTSDVNYFYLFDQTMQWITASTDGLSTEQVEDRNGNLMYWVDETHKGTTLTANDNPVTIYVYTELIKRIDSFELIDGVYTPVRIEGAGTGIGNNGKLITYKKTDGYYMDYYHSTTGQLIQFKLTDDGIISSTIKGFNNVVTGYLAEATGYENTASGNFSVVEGFQNTASGHASRAGGSNNIVAGSACSASGEGNTIEDGAWATKVEGNNNTTNHDVCHLEGYNNSTSGNAYAAHVEGASNVASEYASHVEGKDNLASGFASHAQGSQTVASNFAAHSQGANTEASGFAAHAGGFNTKALSDFQTVVGMYNIPDDMSDNVFIVGNGDSDEERSNAFEVKTNGDANITGQYLQNGVPITVGTENVNFAMEAKTLYVGYALPLTGSFGTGDTLNLIEGTGIDFQSYINVNEVISIESAGNFEIRKVTARTETQLTLDSNLLFSHTSANLTVYKAGNDANDGSAPDAAHALATVQKAIDITPKALYNSCEIYVHPANYSSVNIRGFFGNGFIAIYPAVGDWDIVSTYYFDIGDVSIMTCQSFIDIEGVRISSGLSINNSNNVFLWSDILETYGVGAFVASFCHVQDCYFANIPYNYCIGSGYGSVVISENNDGEGQIGLNAYNSGAICPIGTQPTGTTENVQETDGGRILASLRGSTANRPTSVPVGYQYFDTDITKPIWWHGTNWKDITETIV